MMTYNSDSLGDVYNYKGKSGSNFGGFNSGGNDVYSYGKDMFDMSKYGSSYNSGGFDMSKIGSYNYNFGGSDSYSGGFDMSKFSDFGSMFGGNFSFPNFNFGDYFDNFEDKLGDFKDKFVGKFEGMIGGKMFGGSDFESYRVGGYTYGGDSDFSYYYDGQGTGQAPCEMQWFLVRHNKKCLAAAKLGALPVMRKCDNTKTDQLWHFAQQKDGSVYLVSGFKNFPALSPAGKLEGSKDNLATFTLQPGANGKVRIMHTTPGKDGKKKVNKCMNKMGKFVKCTPKKTTPAQNLFLESVNLMAPDTVKKAGL
jgi:hypothetical protein